MRFLRAISQKKAGSFFRIMPKTNQHQGHTQGSYLPNFMKFGPLVFELEWIHTLHRRTDTQTDRHTHTHRRHAKNSFFVF